MSDKGQAMLDQMPPYYSEDDATRTVIDVQGREFQRIEDMLVSLQTKTFVINADDEFRLLGMWEAVMGVPVESDLPVERRRSLLLARIRGRDASTGESWVAAMTESLGTTGWSYSEGPSPYTINITVPYAPGSDNSNRAYSLAREITPAHLHLAMGYTQGFIIGVSKVGDHL